MNTTKPSSEQMEKIKLIESMKFLFFNGDTAEDAEKFISVNYHEALKLSHKLGMSRKRKGRNRYNGLPIKITG